MGNNRYQTYRRIVVLLLSLMVISLDVNTVKFD